MNKLAKSTIAAYLGQRLSYILGVVVGLSLIFINVYIGLYMLDLVLTDEIIIVKDGVSLPVINKQGYDQVKGYVIRRGSKELITVGNVDPFKVN